MAQNQEHIDLYYIIHGKHLENLVCFPFTSQKIHIFLCQAAHSSGGECNKTSGEFMNRFVYGVSENRLLIVPKRTPKSVHHYPIKEY